MINKFTALSIGALAIGFAVVSAPQLSASLDSKASVLQMARHGADDPAGDDRGRRHGGHGADDGAGHASLTVEGVFQMARRGADDAAGDKRHGEGAGHA